jgi:hypothetical protein
MRLPELIIITAYWGIQDDLKKLNKKILSGKYEFHKLKEDIHYFVSFYKEKHFKNYIFGEKKEELTKEEEKTWFEDITDMLELAKYSEEPSFIKNKHTIDLFIKSMEEDNTYTLLNNTISSHSYKRALFFLDYNRDTLDYNLDSIDSEIVQEHILGLQDAVDYLDSHFFKKEHTEYKKKMRKKLLTVLNNVKYNKFFREDNTTKLIKKLIEKVQENDK